MPVGRKFGQLVGPTKSKPSPSGSQKPSSGCTLMGIGWVETSYFANSASGPARSGLLANFAPKPPGELEDDVDDDRDADQHGDRLHAPPDDVLRHRLTTCLRTTLCRSTNSSVYNESSFDRVRGRCADGGTCLAGRSRYDSGHLARAGALEAGVLAQTPEVRAPLRLGEPVDGVP